MELLHLDIKEYISKAVENEHFQNYEIEITGATGKSDGYASYMAFATVIATTQEGNEKNIDLAVKCSKGNMIDLYRSLYHREVFFYSTIWPEFKRFQEENNIKHRFTSIPKCYKTISNNKVECIIMENLRKSGYRLHSRKESLNLEHTKFILQEYGKLHAISFALRESEKETYKKLTSSLTDVFVDLLDESFKKSFQHGIQRASEIMKELNEEKLYKMCGKILEKNAGVALFELLNTVEPDSVIIHGDCWNNNFLFKYEFEDETSPTKAVFLDWQISRLHSPVLDLSYFIYSTCSQEVLNHFDELLSCYYSSFSTFLKEFKLEAEKIFPFSALQRHWVKYSLFGFFMTTTFLHMTIVDEEEAPDFGNPDGKDMGEMVIDVEIRDPENFRKRLIPVVRHYFENSYSKLVSS